MKTTQPLTAAVFVLVLGALGTQHLHALEERNAVLEQHLRDALLRDSCGPVQVTCVCPEYEEGWDDAEYISGCDPEPIDLEQIEMMCAEFNELGYIPDC